MTSFSREEMEQASREAMPNVPVISSEWLTHYDDYYHQTTTSFELGRHKPAYVLPVLRVRYKDENETWLYFTPSLGQMVKSTNSIARIDGSTTVCMRWTGPACSIAGHCGTS